MPIPQESPPDDLGDGQVYFLIGCGIWLFVGISLVAGEEWGELGAHGLSISGMLGGLWLFTLPVTLLPLAIGTLLHWSKYDEAKRTSPYADKSPAVIYGTLTAAYVGLLAYVALRVAF